MIRGEGIKALTLRGHDDLRQRPIHNTRQLAFTDS